MKVGRSQVAQDSKKKKHDSMYLITVKGIVQGVGFRPYIYRKAVELNEKGYVRNTGDGVEIVVENKDFLKKLTDLPPLAEIHHAHLRKLKKEEIEALKKKMNLNKFTIIPSSKKRGAIFIPPDISVCEDCLRELEDRENRRYGYYFITCTNCGPRFSMIKDFRRAYDRPTTTMSSFPMCERCREEYTDPLNRRYHAQTIACPDCGPSLIYIEDGKEMGSGKEAIELAVESLLNRNVVAVKGNGGYHLSCLVDMEAVRKLRALTGRPKKPYALMMKDLEMAKEYVEIGKEEERLLLNPRAPIVVLEKKEWLKKEGEVSTVFSEVSELSSLGVMLPYTALHHLLLKKVNRPLVMTSANLPGNPMATTLEEIKKLCSNILEHQRVIANRVDDSVLRLCGKIFLKDEKSFPLFLRRARGWTPSKLAFEKPIFKEYLKREGKDLLALGAMKNNTISFLSQSGIYLSHYIGNSDNLLVFEYLKEVVKRFKEISNAKEKVLLCDLHPDFNTTLYAEELSDKSGMELIQVQHHLAHASSVALEHQLEEFTAIVCDGVGYGLDGKPWGGEVFKGKERLASLEEQPMIGGDRAAVECDRMLFGVLNRFLSQEEIKEMERFDERYLIWRRQLEDGVNVPYTTSTGRVLDALSSLLLLCHYNHYQGRGPMLLESQALNYLKLSSNMSVNLAEEILEREEMEPVIVFKERYILKTTPLFEFIYRKVMNLTEEKRHLSWKERLSKAEKREKGLRSKLAFLSHLYLAKGLFQMANKVGKGKMPILFSGGVAVNTIFSWYLSKKGVLFNKEVPPGDGGVSFGQIAYYLIFEKI